MAPNLSKFDTLPFNCYEIGHTWTPSCAKASTDLGISTFKEGFKIYATCYFMSMVASQRFPKSMPELWKSIKDVIRSSTFLSANAFGFMFFFCTLRKLKGNFNYFTLGFLPSVLGCYCAILVEKPQRRPLLALYVANVASETLYRILRSRGMVHDVKHFDLLLFCSSLITMLYYMKKGNRRNDFIDTILTKIFGTEEFARKGSVVGPGSSRDMMADQMGDVYRHNSGIVLSHGEAMQNVDLVSSRRHRLRDESYRARFIRFVLWMHRSVEDIACHLERMVTAVYEGKTHEKCPHKDPCFDYWMKGFCSRFLSGFAIQAALQTASFVRKMLIPKKKSLRLDKTGALLSNSLLYPCIKSGLGLSAMCLAFRLFSCSFRWLQGTDRPMNAATSGIMASALGFAMLRPPASAGLYLFFKAAERVVTESHQRNNWKLLCFLDKIYGGGWSVLYAISTAVLFHCGIMEPQNLKPSYYNFLSKVTGRKLFDINRHLLTAYYVHSNVLMKDFWPKFNEKFLSDNMKSLVKMREASGKGNELIRDIVLKFSSGSSI